MQAPPPPERPEPIEELRHDLAERMVREKVLTQELRRIEAIFKREGEW